ncbi:hypothetical protein [Sessilibacter sp. MAH4]
MANNVDLEKLDEQKVRTKIHGEYLLVWNKVMEHLDNSDSKLKLSEYLIVFDETEDNYIVTFTRPFKKPILGGGVGEVIINKDTFEIIKFKLTR